MTNLPDINAICAEPDVINSLPLDALDAILAKAELAGRQVAFVKKAITTLVEGRYAPAISEAYQVLSKDTGTVRLIDGEFEIVVDRPKKVKWDQDGLLAAKQTIERAGDNPAEYLDITLSVPERKYAAWPKHIRDVFEPARTVEPGSATIKFSKRGVA